LELWNAIKEHLTFKFLNALNARQGRKMEFQAKNEDLNVSYQVKHQTYIQILPHR